MPQKDENIFEGEIPVYVNFGQTVMGKVSSRKLESGAVEMKIFLRKEYADEIVALVKDEYEPVALSFSYMSHKPYKKREE